LIPADSEVPPSKSANIGGTGDEHHAHVEHAMNLSPGNFNILICFSFFK
jgi:hypothetical protein